MKEENNKIIIYNTVDGGMKIEVKLDKETVWLTQAQMVELFQKDQRTISEHISNIFREGELDKNETTGFTGNSGNGFAKPIIIYNLDVIISVGYRVSSLRGTQFRIWATKQLKEYLIKGFILNDERLSEGKLVNGINYFDELLERIRAIRASEKRFYQKIRDVYLLSADYDPKNPMTPPQKKKMNPKV